MDGGDHEIEARKQLLVIIEASVGKDIALDTLEKVKILVLRIEGVDGRPLPQHVVRLKAPGVVGAFAVVADAHIRQAHLPGALRDGRKSGGAVAHVRMDVERPFHVGRLDEPGERARLGRLYLAHILPQLRRHK